MESEIIINNITKFPCKLKKEEGRFIKRELIKDKELIHDDLGKKDIELKYHGVIGGRKYILVEEYLFRENETLLNIKNSIGVNYYINRI